MWRRVFEEADLSNLNWLTDPGRHILVNPVVRLGCSVWLEGRSYDVLPSAFELIKVWSPTLAPFRRLVGKDVESQVAVIQCAGGPLDCVSDRALTIVPQWGRRRFVFLDDQGTRSPVLKVVNRVSPSTVRLGLPAIGVSVAELPGGAAVGKAELDLSKTLSVEVKVAAAVDPEVVVSLVTGDELGTAWAALIAADTGLTTVGATRWLLRALEDDSPDRDRALAFLEEVLASGVSVESSLSPTDEGGALARVLKTHPFSASASPAHGGGDDELSAARDYVALVAEWDVAGLLAPAQRHRELRTGPRPAIFIGDEQDPRPTAEVHIDEGESVDVTFTLVGLGPDVTRFATKASTVIDGVNEDVYSDVVSIAERDGSLVWWEDPDLVTVIEQEREMAVL